MRIAGPSGAAGTIHTTTTHPFWSQTSGSWVTANALAPGTGLGTPSGAGATVTAVRSYTGAKTMYDLTVEDVHTFYVASGDTPVLVHNINADCPLVLGIKKFSEALAKQVNGRTFNAPEFREKIGDGPKGPLFIWMTLVQGELSANEKIAVALDGFAKINEGAIGDAKAAFITAYVNGSRPGWTGTEWEMYQIGVHIQRGEFEWKNATFYFMGVKIDLPEPMWNKDPSEVRFP